MLFCSLCNHRDLHKNKGHKSVLVRKMHPSLPPSVMVAFGKTVIINYVKDKIGVVFLRSCVIFDTL